MGSIKEYSEIIINSNHDLLRELGKYNREAKSGLNIVIPGLERIIIVDMKSKLLMFRHKKLLQKTM